MLRNLDMIVFALKKSSRASASPWSLRQLEPRLMLAGDVAAEVAPVDGGETNHDSAYVSTPTHLVFVDSAVDDIQSIVGGIEGSHELILLTPNESGISQISRVLAKRCNVQSIHVIAHGQAGQITLGNQAVNEEALDSNQSQIRSWATVMTSDADILLYACDTAQGSQGQSFIQRLARLTGADVAASTDLTGGIGTEGDWVLEATVGQIESSLALTQSARQHYQHTLAISISAAGVTGEEEMELLVGGEVVQTWTGIGGDAYAGQFQTFSHNLDGVAADDVRIRFTNDLYDPENGIDRNIRIDNISIDGVVYETEAPEVFSTGTWLPADGIVSGFRQSEYLHTDGYFQYSGSPPSTGTLITIAAEGFEGDESFSLRVNGAEVQAWSDVPTSASIFTYQSALEFTIDDIQIEFNNDLYDVAGGIDRNLRVDYVEVDSVRYETEAPTTYSTGTWTAESGITPGFHQSDTLHTNGFFQYNMTPANPGEIGLTLDSLTIDEDLGTLNFVVFRGGGSDGTVTVDYETQTGSADHSDFAPAIGTLVFADGVTGQQVSVQINDDSEIESDETFSFVINNPTGGAALAAITTQVVTITDNDEVTGGIIFEDSFETASGWTTNPGGTDTATTGQWEIGSPQGTSSSGTTLQFNAGHTGPGALVTGLAAGSSVGAFDIDSGVTSVLSPEIDLPVGAEIELSFEYNLAYLGNSSNDDYFRASVVANGSTTEVYYDHAHNSINGASWVYTTVDLSPFAGETVQVLFEAADEAGGSLVEAAVDDVVVEVLPSLPGTINVVSTGVNVDEAVGTATVTVGRASGRVGEVTVDYATVAGSAGNSDYTPTSGTITFVDGQATAEITVAITDDSVEENLETFQLVISNPTGGAILGTDTAASITIADNDNTVADYLPDLVPIESTLTDALSIDTSEIPGRTLLRFSTEVANAGDGPLEIWGGSVTGSSQQVFQRIYQVDGGYRDILAGEFVYHAGHGHIHFEGFATYDLVLRDGSGNIVASGGKTSFCIINIRQPFPDVTADAGLVHGRGGDSCGQVQGLSVGYSDVYSASLDDQWIDVTDIADGQYWLEITTDPENNLQETDETNNTARVAVTLSGGQVSY